MKVRVHELAAEIGIDSARVMELLRAMNVSVRGPSSSVEAQPAEAVRQVYRATPADGHRLIAEHQRAMRSLLAASHGFSSVAKWDAELEHRRAIDSGKQAAAAISRAKYEEDRRARADADARRWVGTYDRPRSFEKSRKPVVYYGGAPGLGKRS